MEVQDIVIIGSGPAGYTAAIYAARAGFRPLLIAGSLTAGGALMNTTEVENFPGFSEGIMGPELMETMLQQAERFGTEVLYEDVVTASLTEEPKRLTLESGEEVLAKAVILATGSAYRKLGVPGEEEFSGRGVSWCATCDGALFRDKEIMVIGGGDSAMEEATFLTRFAKKVTLVHRRDSFRASKIMADRLLANPQVEVLWNTVVEEVRGDKQVSHVLVTQEGQQRELPVEGIFVAIGHDPRSELVAEEVHRDAEGYILVQEPHSATNIPGVFACGDVVDHYYRQAITAAGSGCKAALDAQHYLQGV